MEDGQNFSRQVDFYKLQCYLNNEIDKSHLEPRSYILKQCKLKNKLIRQTN